MSITPTLRICLIIVCFSLVFNSSFQKVAAAEVTPTHFTVILHQLRGPECCERGNVKWFKRDLESLENNELVGNFAIRYDALQSESYIELIKKDAKNEYGALLEVTPQLAQHADVTYKSDPARWYEAQNVFLIGYTQEERKKIIDTYMAFYEKQMGVLPKFSSAWMIDAWSLAYLKEKYGIVAHQITREQFGTDSYTLYGGPVHYPYYPSSNWALIPDNTNTKMPLMMRQTIMDPVFVYGDKTDSYTSQPNDYFIRDDTTEYFKHLFFQAHAQNNPYTFALIGLENTMSESIQAEYEDQLRVVGTWQKNDASNRAVTISAFETWLRQQTNELTSYAGAAQKDANEKAWWINTPTYRARVRLSAGELSITDLRLYHKDFKDPYISTPAKSFGWWVVPFVLDGSRYFEGSTGGSIIKNDFVKNRPAEVGAPIKIILSKNVNTVELVNTENGKLIKSGTTNIVLFTPKDIQFTDTISLTTLTNLPPPLIQLKWTTSDEQDSWGFTLQEKTLLPFVNSTDLDAARNEYKPFLFPEKQFDTLHVANTSLYINNNRSIAGRNPVRLVLFPKNEKGEAILLPSYPQVTAEPHVEEIEFHEQHQNNGMIFIDFLNAKPMKTHVTVTHGDFSDDLTIYFAPNCKEQKLHCILHPRQAWWYLRTYLDDRARAKEEQRQKEEAFVD